MTVASAPRILRTVQQVRQWRLDCLLNRESVGFIPTMGALHAGHCSLIAESLKQNDHTMVSIFVNPSQFAPHEDLDAYPRTVDSDMDQLTKAFTKKQVSAVFIPKVSEMYPSGIELEVSKQRGAFVTVHGCSEQLEGGSRPQFFRGVATVVSKLLNVVTPEKVYFGQKDAQQCVVIRNLVKDMLINTEVVVLPTLRESSGLAMSSRNAYLSEEAKSESSVIYRALKAGESFYDEHSKDGEAVDAYLISNEIRNVLSTAPSGFKLEYLSISHPETLDDLTTVKPGIGALISTAVRVPREDGQETRLIDNIVLK
ncbi:pantoate--beta-alanine ligase [[Candida] anglica]|uniref:Pantoate--beta-alanine ligase n=1 Tax=[Candida] anglica TaxID=148631 RepID=A0ABP0EH38_9ASCO